MFTLLERWTVGGGGQSRSAKYIFIRDTGFLLSFITREYKA